MMGPVLLTNREIIVLIGEVWPQIVCFFDSVNQSSITSLGLSAKDSFITFYAKRFVC